MIVGILILAALICGFMFGYGLANYRNATLQIKMRDEVERARNKFLIQDEADWWKQGKQHGEN